MPCAGGLSIGRPPRNREPLHYSRELHLVVLKERCWVSCNCKMEAGPPSRRRVQSKLTPAMLADKLGDRRALIATGYRSVQSKTPDRWPPRLIAHPASFPEPAAMSVLHRCLHAGHFLKDIENSMRALDAVLGSTRHGPPAGEAASYETAARLAFNSSG